MHSAAGLVGGRLAQAMAVLSVLIAGCGDSGLVELEIIALQFRPDNQTCVAPDLNLGATVPDLLSMSGCVDSGDITKPYNGLVPFYINSVLWSDGATKERFMGLPNSTAIAIDDEDDWVFPAGTIITKNFRLNGRLVETRHLMRHPDGEWAGYTYEWNATSTEATRVVGGKVVNIGGQEYNFPSEEDCVFCHNDSALVAIGPETAQLNREVIYPDTQMTVNQLEILDRIALFTSPLAGTPETLPRLVDPMKTTADLSDRARSYLHVNCSGCHRPGGPTPASMDFRYFTPLSIMNACDVAPTRGDLGLINPRIIAPGDAANSVVVERMSRRDQFGMPPIATSIVHSDGVALLTGWINNMHSCN